MPEGDDLVVGGESPGAVVGVGRRGIVAEDLEHVAQFGPRLEAIGGGDRRLTTCVLERPTQEPGGVGERMPLVCTAGRGTTALPRPGVHPRPVVVQGEQLGHFLDASGVTCLDHTARDLMELAASSIRQPRVGDLSIELVLERVRARHLAVDERVEHVDVGVGDLLARHRPQELEVERRTEERGLSQEVAMSRRQLVDPGGDQPFDRVGHLFTRAGERKDLLEEQRVALGAACEVSGDVEGHHPPRRREVRERVDGSRVERLERDRLVHDLGECRRARREHHEPVGRRHDRRHEVLDETPRRLVDPLHVLEPEDRVVREEADQQVADGRLQPGAPVAGVEPAFGLAGLDGDVDHRADQRRPLAQVGGLLFEPGQQVVRPGIGPEVQDEAQQTAEREVRRAGLVAGATAVAEPPLRVPSA